MADTIEEFPDTEAIQEFPDPVAQDQIARTQMGSAEYPVPRDANELAAQTLKRRGYGTAAFVPEKLHGTEEPNFKLVPELTPAEQELLKQAPPDQQRVAGYAQGVAKTINSLTSTDNLFLLGSTFGLGGTPAAARAIGLGFAAQMASQVPHIAQALGEEYGKAPEDRDQQKIGQLIAEGAATTGFTLAAAHGALKPEVTPATKLARMLDRSKLEAGPIQEFPDSTLTLDVPERATPAGGVEVDPFAPLHGAPLIEGSTVPPWAQGAIPAPREKPGRPVVPETPAQPRVSGVEEVRQAGAKTIRQIQELFPQAELSREQARELRDLAFPKEDINRGDAETQRAEPAPESATAAEAPVQEFPDVPTQTAATDQPETKAADPATTPPAAAFNPNLKDDLSLLQEVIDTHIGRVRRAQAEATRQTQESAPAQSGDVTSRQQSAAPQAEAPGSVAEAPRVARGLRARKVFDSETAINGPDILSWISENMPMASKTAAKAAKSKDWWQANQSLYDDAAPLQRPHHNIIYTGKSMPDQVAQAAYEAGALKEPDVTELWRAIRQASNRRASAFENQRSQEAAIQHEITAHKDWLKATKKGETRIEADDLKVGDHLEVAGEKVKVTGVDADTGDVTLEDGTKFGIQRLSSGKAIHVEKYQPAEATEDFAPADTAEEPFQLNQPETVEQQKARLAAEADKARLAAKLAKPLVGTAGDLGQGDLLKGPEDLFAPPSPIEHKMSASAPANKFLKDIVDVQAAIAPQTLGPAARYAGNILRELGSKMANRLLRADESLKEYRKSFDKTQVPKDYQFVEGQPLPRNYAFIDAYEGGNAAALGPEEARAAAAFKKLNEDWLSRIHALGTGALKTFYENYFPHLWQNPERAAQVITQILAKRPLEGPKSFLKQRTHQLFVDGLRAGLTPVHDNPVDMFLLKHREVERYILGKSFVQQMKDANLLKYVSFGGKVPEGWGRVANERAFEVYAPPFVKVKEAFDAGMRERTLQLLSDLGVPHERTTRLGKQDWGLMRGLGGVPGSESIKSKFGGPDFVLWHELGHVLDNRYPELRTRMSKWALNEPLGQQLQALADLRYEGEQPSAKFQNYVRSMPEKMAVILQAYIHAPDRMAEVAPLVKKELEIFIAHHPELAGLNEIRPSLRLGEGQAEIPLAGVVKMGEWYMPQDAVKIVNNYLSPGLQSHAAYQTIRATSNILNGAQLGLSAFHLGFTSLDAAVSRLAVGLEDLSRGEFKSGLKTIGSVPFSPVTNIMQGAKLRAEIMRPGSQSADVASVVKALEAAGGRVGQDAFWQTQFTRRLQRAFREGTASGYARGVVSAPFALLEQTMKPIMEYVVPRQKLGVFADMARRELAKLGPDADPSAVREVMAKAWDSVDNRMGQVVYDNLFYNRAVKDIALLTFRAYGWQLGKYRELGGGLADIGAQVKALSEGKRPEMTHRMAYMLALPVLVGTMGALTQRLMTGKNPEDYRDYFMPRTGETDANGREQRINLPSYMKDVLSIAKHPLSSVGHSLNPLIAVVADMIQNKDYYDTRILNPDDPMSSKLKDAGLYLGKQFVPFSVSGTMKLREDAPPLWKQVMPFFGVTPTPNRLTTTPAEELSGEIMSDMMPKGARTKEQFDRAQLVKEIVKDIKSGKRDAARSELVKGIQAGQITEGSMNTLMDRLQYTPLQFQVHHFSAEDAMKVWRIGTPAERRQLQKIIASKIVGSRTLDDDRKVQLLKELTGTAGRN